MTATFVTSHHSAFSGVAFLWLVLAHPAVSAYARFLAFSARTGLIGTGCKASAPDTCHLRCGREPRGFLPWALSGRRPQASPHCRNGPSSEALHTSAQSPALPSAGLEPVRRARASWSRSSALTISSGVRLVLFLPWVVATSVLPSRRRRDGARSRGGSCRGSRGEGARETRLLGASPGRHDSRPAQRRMSANSTATQVSSSR